MRMAICGGTCMPNIGNGVMTPTTGLLVATLTIWYLNVALGRFVCWSMLRL